MGSRVPETILYCLHVIFEEEWEHHRIPGGLIPGLLGERLSAALKF
jgi:hypothetical protein